MFQFQYGTIKRVLQTSETQETPLFQFQYGTIKSKDEITVENNFNVSIPIWYD